VHARYMHGTCVVHATSKQPPGECRMQNAECRMQKGGTNPCCGSATPGHSSDLKLGGLPLQAQTYRMAPKRSSPALGTMKLDSTAEKGTVHEP
jgi:hypothetical protein